MSAKLVSAIYIWLDAKQNLRDKEWSIYMNDRYRVGHLPQWKFDGSSTGQAIGEFSDVFICPVYVCKNPFRKNDRENILVLCETYNPNETRHKTNLRYRLKELMEKYKEHEPWAGFEQEWFVTLDGQPIGASFRDLVPQGPYFCSVGIDVNFGGEIKDEHYNLCLDAGLSIAGTNTEVAPGQHEFQIGPIKREACPKDALTTCDELIIARWLLHKIAASYGLGVSFDPKPMEGDWNGSGCHTNFSIKEMREKDGIQKIYEAAERLKINHSQNIQAYGEGNEQRLSGQHETSSIDVCDIGIGDRGKAIRIPTDVAREGRGYMEIRQPAANCSPYLVLTAIIETVLGNRYKHQKTD